MRRDSPCVFSVQGCICRRLGCGFWGCHPASMGTGCFPSPTLCPGSLCFCFPALPPICVTPAKSSSTSSALSACQLPLLLKTLGWQRKTRGCCYPGSSGAIAWIAKWLWHAQTAGTDLQVTCLITFELYLVVGSTQASITLGIGARGKPHCCSTRRGSAGGALHGI